MQGTHDTGRTTPDLARAHATLRFAFGVTLALVACELLQWLPTFLGPVLVGALLVNVPIRPPLKVAVGLIAIIAASAFIAMLLSTALVRSPLILFGVAAVVVFRSLYAVAEGRSRLAPLLLLICVTTIPVIALQSSAIAASFAFALVRAACLAVLVVWISYLLWPRVRPPRPASPVAPLPPDARLRRALLGTAILTPLMLLYLMFGIADALPVLVATTMIVVNLDFNSGRMQAVALVAGNVGGGIAALVLIVLLAMQPFAPCTHAAHDADGAGIRLEDFRWRRASAGLPGRLQRDLDRVHLDSADRSGNAGRVADAPDAVRCRGRFHGWDDDADVAEEEPMSPTNKQPRSERRTAYGVYQIGEV